MFRNKYQHGLMSVLYSCGSRPLELWDMHVKNGYIRRVTDDEVKSLALEIAGTNVTTTYIFCPCDPKKVLGIKLPFLIMIIKNMKKYFTFEITILDDKDMHRRFRMSNFQSTTRVRPFCTSMPIGLSGGWNQIQFNLADFTRRAYGTNYVETTRIQIHANCRVRRIYFADRLYSEDELPEDFKLFKPLQRVKCVREKDVAKEKREEPEKIETEEPPPFEAGEVPEEAEEEPEEEPTEDELAEEEVAPVVDVRRPDEIGEEDEEEEDEDEVEPADVGDYEDEDEVDEPVPAPTTPGYATEDETDVEQDEGDEDEEYGVP
ncbi:cilia- and flagella-associated protein 20-like isoform X1 [Bombus pyrosoma]|uniref:cilia- and flagella-associated protein 20-like isoform X1 n=2 Tax=Bombus pyrosoma TaxID=396416 RepID=UPI001CB91448|nr:cilia- and flagella-associated protein 20-like isoform X1 [Bombus pyrosoma]